MTSPARHNRVNLRLTHPTLYWGIVMIGIGSIGIALAYWFGPAPTFRPYGIDVNLIALGFFVYGLWQMVFLHFSHHLLMIRIGLTFGGFFMPAWGLANTLQGFAGKSSFVFPIAFFILGGLQLNFLTESPVNPMTQKGGDNGVD